jgi:hypothetical protein
VSEYLVAEPRVVLGFNIVDSYCKLGFQLSKDPGTDANILDSVKMHNNFYSTVYTHLYVLVYTVM